MLDRISVRKLIDSFRGRGRAHDKVTELEAMMRLKNCEIEILRGKLAELQEQARFEKNLVPVQDAYTVAEGKYAGWLYCAPCWDSARRQMRLKKADGNGAYVCPACSEAISYGSDEQEADELAEGSL